jgi:hypothetical protein
MQIETRDVRKWIGHLEEFNLLSSHRGKGKIGGGGEELECELSVRANGDCVILATGGSPIAYPWGRGFFSFEMVGESAEGSFQASSSYISIRQINNEPAWALLAPVNGPLKINYAQGRSHLLEAEVLNLDIRMSEGDSRGDWSLEAATKDAFLKFRPTLQADQLLILTRIGSIDSPCLSKFSFHIPGTWNDDEAIAWAVDVSFFCSFVAGVQVGIPLITFYDTDGKPLKRLLRQPIVGKFRKPSRIIPPDSIPQFFSECFAAHINMKETNQAWSKLASYCSSIEDSIFLEQKLVSLLTALEYFLVTSLIEKGQAAEKVTEADLPGLVGQFRRVTQIPIPKEYSEDDIRLLRNALIHPGEKTMKPSRADLDRWRLFLFRLVLMRLGYTGDVFSPAVDILSRSKVNDFRKECNTFPAN